MKHTFELLVKDFNGRKILTVINFLISKYATV